MVLESNTLDVLFVKDGQQGEDGKILYTWIKYAKDASGTGITDDPNGAIYIGISYNNESSIESNDPTHYAWTKIQGADGKKGEDAYTIFLENENISFATDKNRNPLSEQAYTSGITIMKGAKPVTDFTIGDIAKTQGIAVAKTDTAIAISVVNGNPLPNDNGEIEIPITVGGTVFKKILTWTCAKKGDQGEKGENGKDGTSVTIINKSITYQLSTSGTVIPKGTWQTSPQTIPEGQYQWTKTSVTYSDGNKTESYSISYHGKNGNDGTSVKTTGTSVKYQVGDSGTTKPTGTWQSNVPTVAQGKYLWTQTIVNYSDGNSTESYSVSYRGIDGSNGVNGMNTATIYLYQRATSTPSKPSNTLTYTFSTTKITGTLNNGWSTTIPTGTDAVYVTVASVSSKNDTATIATSVWSAPVVLAQNGKTGSDGKAGLNVATIYLYQRNTSKPSKPSASVTYTFSTGVASGLNNGWSQKIPNGTNPLYVTLATASSNTATDTILSSEWSDVVVMAQNGEDGQDGISPKVSLLKSGDTTTISIVDATGTHTQTVKDGTNGTPGAAGKDGKTSYFHVKYSNDGGKTFTGNSGEDTGTYMGSYTDYTEADSTDVKKYNWVKVKGDKGDKGDTGQKGQDGTSVKITSKSVTYQTSTSGTIAPTGTWVTTVPTINNGQYLWTKTTVQYSDGNKTEAYSVSYKGTNGTNGTSVTVSKTEVTYQVSTSGTTAPTGTWSTTMPSCDQGQYLWTKTYVKYSDGKDTTSYSVSYKGVDGEKFAFNMLRETNQGSKHWVNMGASGKYSVESITTEDSINAVKLICTEPIASNEWQFCEFSDYEMLKSLKASTAYTLSYDIKTNRSGKISHNIKTGGGQKPFFANDISCKVLGNETWEHVSLKMTSGTTLPNLDRQVIYMFDNALSKVGYSIIKNLKLTEGIVDTPWAPHPEDLEGRGVSETVQYYLATSQASGVTSFTSGWSTDITTQKLTADKKYLWNCYQTKYSDGTSEPISTPKVIGVYGDKGNGIVASVQRPNKTEFWWSQVGAVGHKDTFDDSSNTRNNCRVGDIFTVMGTSTEGNSHTVYYKSATDSGDLAGECINHVIAESGTDAKNLSITPSSQYFKSTDGGKTFAPNTITIKPTIQGEISFGKWQYSIDGGVSFVDVVSGQKGLTISNNVLSISKDSSLYSDAVTMVTFRAVANDSSFYDTCSVAKIYDVSDIGDGRNLLWNSNFAKTDEAINTATYTTWGLILRGSTYTATIDTSVKHNNFNTLKVIGTKAGENGGQDLIYRIKGLNLDEVKFTETDVKYTLSFYAKASIACNFSARYAYDSYAKDTNVALSTDWKRYEIQMHPTTTSYQTALIFKMDAASTVWFSEFKLEKGSSATGYSTAPEDVQTAILSTKSEISDVSLKVDNNKQAIEQRVEKTTYQQDLKLVKGDISKANEGLNKWRYEIYPKSLFASEYQGKSTMDVFAKNTNLTPSQSVLINDMDLSIAWNYDNNYIGYALTFAKFSAAKSVAITFAHDDGAHIYLNGKLIGGSDAYSQTGESLTLGFVKGWNCIEVVVNEGASTEGFKLGTTISALSECQLMNCYYGTPVARQSHITNQLVENTTNIKGVTTTMQKVMTTVGGSDRIDEFVNNYNKTIESEKQFKKTIGETYTTKDEFNGLEIGGRNLLTKDDCNMSKWQNLYPVHCKVTNNDYSNYIDYVPTSGEWEIIYKKISVTKGQKYILSFDYKVNKAYNYLSGQKYGVYLSMSVPTNAAPANIITDGQYAIENTVTSIKRGVITFTAPIDTLYIVINGGCIDDNQTGLSFEFNKWKLEKGNKATDWTPAHEDDEINGQNLVSNLPSNWEQGSFQDSKTNVGCDYDTNKVSMTTRIRVKELVPVSGTITISNAYSNQSKKPIQHWITAFDVNKKWLGASYVSTAWSDFPRIVDMKDAKYIAVIVKYKDDSAITPSDISQICLKIERGTSATPFTLAPEDVNGKIVNVETIANQTANKFEWIVKGGDSSSNFTLTDRVADLVAERINFKGLVTFSGLNTDAKSEIGKVAQSKVDNLNIGGRNLIINSNLSRTLTNVTNDGCSNMTVVSDSVYGHALKFTAVNQRRVFWATSNVWVKNKTYTVSFVAKSSVTGQKIRPSRSTADWGDDITLTTSYARYTTKITSLDTNAGGTLSFSCTNAVGDITITNVKLEVGNKATDWTPAPEDVSQDATNKASQALTDAKNYSSSAVNWVTNNGSSTTSLNSMVKKWTDGAVSDTTKINGGWIKANTITASKIALADFTNYSQLTRDTAATYGFAVTDDTDGTWFSTQGIRRDQFISEIFPCNGGESYLIEYDISTNAKGANNSTDTKNYISVAIGVYGYTGTVGSNGLPNKATNILYADRITGSETAPSIHVKTTITTSTATKQFRVFLQSDGYYFEGTTKIRNLSVRRMYGGTLIVDGSITADKIATDAIKSRNYISSGGTQGSFLNLSDGSFQSPNLSWDANGNLIAKNANLSGEITAKDGTIGKYKITDQWLITGSGSTCTGIGGNQAFWAGAEDSNSAPFRVNYDGSMISTKGKIGDWKIDKMGLYNDFIVTFGVDQSDGTWLETFYTNYSAKTLYKANAFNNIFLGNKICCMDTHTEYTYLNDNSNKGDITYVESVILENGRINLHSSQYSDSRFALIPYDNYGSHLTLSGEAIEFSSYEADGTYSERNVDAKYTYTYISSDTIKTADVYCSNILRTNNLLVYEIISGRDIHLTSSANQIQLNASNQGSIELYGQTPFIDFHYNYSGDDYTSRIIANGSNLLSITGNLWVDADIHAGSWLYASEVHTSGAVVIASDSESFYWAHGYQIARGTSWGGVCVGDDSQQLRLYGSSIWAAHGISTSDENLKENFTTLDQYEDFYMNLNPIGFNYIGDYDGKKTHFGFGAHKTEDILESEGYDADKFAVVTHRPLVQEDIEKRFGKDVEVDIKTEYGVSYTEFIALNTHMIQKTRRELEQAKQEKADLETRLQAIEAKLGL